MEDAQPIAVINYSLYHEMFPKYSAIYVASTYGTPLPATTTTTGYDVHCYLQF